VAVNDPKGVIMTFVWKIYGFCLNTQPNESEVLNLLMLFMQAAKAPDLFDDKQQVMRRDAAAVSGKVTWTNGMNSPTTVPSSMTRSSTTPTATPPPSNVAAALATCWVSEPCAHFRTDLTKAYKLSGDMKDPNQRGQNGAADQSRVFQAGFCEDNNYKESVYTVA
jgi:hypothetical protein